MRIIFTEQETGLLSVRFHKENTYREVTLEPQMPGQDWRPEICTWHGVMNCFVQRKMLAVRNLTLERGTACI